MTLGRISAVTVYCSSSNSVDACYFGAARRVGAALAKSGRTLVYGGGKVGLMGEAARACRAGGGKVVGVITQTLKDAEQMDPDNHEVIVVETMRERKRLLEQRGEAMVVLPGGLGTMEEFFEILVGRLLGEHEKPIVVINTPEPGSGGKSGFYDPMLSMIDHMIAQKFAKPGVRGLFAVCSDPEEMSRALDEFERSPRTVIDRRSLVPSGTGG